MASLGVAIEAARAPRERQMADRCRVAADAVLLDDSAGRFNRLDDMNIFESKGPGMAEPAFDLGRPFFGESGGKVAVVAGDRAVRADSPLIVGLSHDVAVEAGVGIVDQVRMTACVSEGKDGKAGNDSGGGGGHEQRCCQNPLFSDQSGAPRP